eukprot:5351850-Pleurochrysis_carterae.AAC.2
MAAVVKKTWFEDMIEALSEVKRDAHGNIPSEQYCNAIARIPGIYDALFGNVPPVSIRHYNLPFRTTAPSIVLCHNEVQTMCKQHAASYAAISRYHNEENAATPHSKAAD